MKQAGGFTLLEVLIALALAGLLAVGLDQSMRTLLLGYATESRALSVTGNVAAVDQLLRGMIAQARSGSFTGQPPDFHGAPDRLSFVTDLPDPRGDTTLRGADVSLQVDHAHRLVLAWLAHYRTWLGPDRTPAATVLLEDVDKLEAAYWRPAEQGEGEVPGAWVSPWTDPWPPRLVRLRIVLRSTGPRHAPGNSIDIVAATMRDRWQP